jgi:DNA mismatch repair protein MutL
MVVRIKQLPEQVANQIAAGEVIERPASVVKELLENALDAEASYIQITIDYGGVNRIKIVDDGVGIVQEDLPLAVSAHATSKISNLNDLFKISSMGFRGEALASIASISRLSITSKARDSEEAYQLTRNQNGFKVDLAARSVGTTIEVVDLFYNAPVRKKFLKAEKTEYQAIEMVVRRFALSEPAISISLIHNGKQTLHLPAALNEKTKLQRIQKLFGKEFIEQAIQIDVERSGMRLQGWIGGKDYHRSQSDKLWIYLNHRMVKDKLLQHAIKQSYEDVLPPGRYPGCLLYLEVPAQEVDVNVHPTKHEVRFQQPRLVHDLVVSQLAPLLHQNQQATYDIVSPLENKQVHETRQPYVQQMHFKGAASDVSEQTLTLLNDSYAVMFYEQSPYLVDVKALYKEGLLQQLAKKTIPFDARPLLVPVRLALNHAETFIADFQEGLTSLGVEIQAIGDNELIVRSIPVDLPQLDIERFITLFSQHPAKTLNEQLMLLVDAYDFDASILDSDGKQDLSVMLADKLAQSRMNNSWCRPLDANKCRDILNG